MKRYRFRMEQVLRVRRIQEDMARQNLVASNRRARGAADAYHVELDRLGAMPVVTGVLDSRDYLSRRAEEELAADTVHSAEQAMTAAAADAESARHAFVEAAQRVDALERLDRRRRDEHALEEGRTEVREADDLTAGRWVAST